MFTIKYLHTNWFVEIWITFSEHSINLQHNDKNLLIMKSIPEPLPLPSTYRLSFGFLFFISYFHQVGFVFFYQDVCMYYNCIFWRFSHITSAWKYIYELCRLILPKKLNFLFVVPGLIFHVHPKFAPSVHFGSLVRVWMR